ncbi:thiopeptide-type bacteriocin biosynthesis protein [Enterococcus innesii]|uniref:thiopeptide-type bacteriocin biosynthesis protein n=3 Tax=Enterococcus innesii TaxID=2839759 RepID=UPI003B5B8303
MKNIYHVENTFHLRYCNLKYVNFKEDISTLDSTRITDYIIKNMDKFEFPLYYANHTLYYKLINHSSLSSTELQSIGVTMYNYLARMAFRPTPFGAFNTFMVGEFSPIDIQESNQEYIDSKFCMSVEISEIWLNDLKSKIEENFDYYPNIAIQLSPFVSLKSKYITIFDGNVNPKNEKYTKIKRTKLLDYIVTTASTPINIKKVSKLICNKFHISNLEDCYKYIKNLIKKGVLISDVYKENSYSNKLENLLYKVKIKENDVLLKIISLLHQLNSVDSSKEVLMKSQEIISLQRMLVESKQYLYINALNREKVKLSKNAKSEVEKFSNIISYFTTNIDGEDFLETYKQFISSRNDAEAPISALRLIDETYRSINIEENEVTQARNNKNNSYDRLAELIAESIYLKTDLELSDDVIDNFYLDYLDSHQSELIDNFDILFSIRQFKDNNKLCYYYIPQSINTPAGGYIGRVNHLFNNKKAESLPPDKYLKNNFQEVRIFDQSFDFKAADLVEKENPFSLPTIDFTFSMENSIDFKEISVVLKNNKIVTFLNDSKSALLVKQFNMINSLTVYNRLYQLLYMTRLQFQNHLSDFFENLVHQFYYVPRITYKNLTLVKRHWKITYEQLTYFDKKIKINSFKAFCEKINLPTWIGISMGPDTSYYNLENDMHVEGILSSLKKNGFLILTEWEGDIYSDSSESISLGRNNQFVFTLKNPNYKLAYSFYQNNNYIEDPINKEWESIKIYFQEEFQNIFILSDLPHIIEYLEALGVKEIFFIRYMDPNPHIRLRFKKEESNIDFDKIRNIIYQSSSGIEIKEISIAHFCPEYNRYGGVSATKKILKFFCAETAFLMDKININNILENDEFVVAHTYSYLLDLNISKKEIMDLMKQFKRYKISQKLIYKTVEGAYVHLEQLRNKKMKIENDLAITFSEFLDDRDYILLSIIHMTINRICSYNPEKEQRIMKLMYEFSRDNFYRN